MSQASFFATHSYTSASSSTQYIHKLHKYTNESPFHVPTFKTKDMKHSLKHIRLNYCLLSVLSIQNKHHTINGHNFYNMSTGRERRRLGASQ